MPGQTLQATALVHEAYLRLVGNQEPAVSSQEPSNWNGRGHFFGAAAEAMRRILVERARRKQAAKRGGERQRVELSDVPASEQGAAVDLLTLDEALNELAAVDPRSADLVKLRYFAGLSGEDAAKALGISTRTADRTWLYARTWLLKKMENSERP
jgi:RNA polymerase sigma factor (TIGR02999 family)